ncbi:hypothetical protein MFUL124B02_04100 [Myxococcus fulvus 124B02]|nr:hypothetical protein MFUL124B02_04100 [Myxococcus fulvus 124B02]
MYVPIAWAARTSRWGTSCGSAFTTGTVGPPSDSTRPVRTPSPLAHM